MARWFIGFLPLALVAACGDDSNNEDPLATASGFCQQWAERACSDRVVDFCSQKPDLDACIESQSDFCSTLVRPSKYNKAGARGCLDAVEKAYKDAILDSDEYQVVHHLGIPCDQVIGASGVFCEKDKDCEDPDDPDAHYCQEREGSSMGICVIQGGFSCKNTELSCGSNFYCDGRVCAALSNSGDECATDDQCKPEFKCVVPEDSDTGTCKPRLGVDKECDQDADCKTHMCWDGKCSTRVILTDSDPICEDLS